MDSQNTNPENAPQEFPELLPSVDFDNTVNWGDADLLPRDPSVDTVGSEAPTARIERLEQKEARQQRLGELASGESVTVDLPLPTTRRERWSSRRHARAEIKAEKHGIRHKKTQKQHIQARVMYQDQFVDHKKTRRQREAGEIAQDELAYKTSRYERRAHLNALRSTGRAAAYGPSARLGRKIDREYDRFEDAQNDEVVRLLSFEDTMSKKRARAERKAIKTSDEAMDYVYSLKQLFENYGKDEVLDQAERMRDEALDALEVVDIPASEYTESISWVLWGMAERMYELDEEMEETGVIPLDDVMTSMDMQDEMIDEQIGHEAYQHLHGLPQAEVATYFLPHHQVLDIVDLVGHDPVEGLDEETLSNEDLARLGRLVGAPAPNY